MKTKYFRYKIKNMCGKETISSRAEVNYYSPVNIRPNNLFESVGFISPADYVADGNPSGLYDWRSFDSSGVTGYSAAAAYDNNLSTYAVPAVPPRADGSFFDEAIPQSGGQTVSFLTHWAYGFLECQPIILRGPSSINLVVQRYITNQSPVPDDYGTIDCSISTDNGLSWIALDTFNAYSGGNNNYFIDINLTHSLAPGSYSSKQIKIRVRRELHGANWGGEMGIRIHDIWFNTYQ